MSRTPINAVPVGQQPRSLPARRISLTPAQTAPPLSPVSVAIAELLAYSQGNDFTRLNLIGGKVLDVKETIHQIDLLVRAAASQSNFLPGQISLSD